MVPSLTLLSQVNVTAFDVALLSRLSASTDAARVKLGSVDLALQISALAYGDPRLLFK